MNTPKEIAEMLWEWSFQWYGKNGRLNLYSVIVSDLSVVESQVKATHAWSSIKTPKKVCILRSLQKSLQEINQHTRNPSWLFCSKSIGTEFWSFYGAAIKGAVPMSLYNSI